MTTWPAIYCQRGHERHATRLLDIDLGKPHGYSDYTPIPERFAQRFKMYVYDPEIHPVDGGDYCPAHDVVSETLASHGIWEPRETVLALSVFATAPKGSVFYDMGAQIGWYSLLAASSGLKAHAFEADEVNLSTLKASFKVNGWSQMLRPHLGRIGSETPAIRSMTPVRLAKLDLEGAEDQAIRMLWPLIEARKIDHLMIECSPVFADYYGELVVNLIHKGYVAYRLPPKFRPPVILGYDLNVEMQPYRISHWTDVEVIEWVDSCGQEDLWFRRFGAGW